MSTLDLRRKSYFSRRSNPKTLKFGIYAKNQSSSSIFCKITFWSPDPRKITKWSSIFSKFSNWSSKYSTSPPSSQNSQIHLRALRNCILFLSCKNYKFMTQVSKNYKYTSLPFKITNICPASKNFSSNL